MKKPLLNVLLCELRDQMRLIEPHSDAEIDSTAYRNSMDLVDYLILHSEGNADLRKVCHFYYKEKKQIPTENFIETQRWVD
jgi:hypothetical protein